MSLKAFHVAFIFLSAALASGFAAWCFAQQPQVSYLVAGVVSAAAAVALAAYGIRFIRKTKDLGYL